VRWQRAHVTALLGLGLDTLVMGVDVADLDQVPHSLSPGEHHVDAPTRLGECAGLPRDFERPEAAIQPEGARLDPLDGEKVLHPVFVGHRVGSLDGARPLGQIPEEGGTSITSLTFRWTPRAPRWPTPP
jgi:hypothetical protein